MTKPDETVSLTMCGPSRPRCACRCPDGPCEHVWDGPWVGDEREQSATCSRCGMDALSHSMWVGP